MILKNPVYCGKIAYGRRKTEKVHGTRNEYRLVEQENFLLVDGLHAAIIPEDVWQAAQVKLAAQAKRYEHVNKGKNECTHLLSGIVKCPICGVGTVSYTHLVFLLLRLRGHWRCDRPGGEIV